ncbi:MAG TPA: hypothetical protein VFM02_04765 [Candidatus Paceibacterota bacterium]|nr:hypothetical protein [Candidatus Paceibacterota bacterium]
MHSIDAITLGILQASEHFIVLLPAVLVFLAKAAFYCYLAFSVVYSGVLILAYYGLKVGAENFAWSFPERKIFFAIGMFLIVMFWLAYSAWITAFVLGSVKFLSDPELYNLHNLLSHVHLAVVTTSFLGSVFFLLLSVAVFLINLALFMFGILTFLGGGFLAFAIVFLPEENKVEEIDKIGYFQMIGRNVKFFFLFWVGVTLWCLIAFLPVVFSVIFMIFPLELFEAMVT